MKPRIAGLMLAAFMMTLTACNNEKKQETTETKSETKKAPAEAEKTKVSVGPDGAALETKDVDVKVNTRDTTKN